MLEPAIDVCSFTRLEHESPLAGSETLNQSAMKYLLSTLGFALLVCFFLVGDTNAQLKKTTLVHYMPWYSAKPDSNSWGWHWTMNHFTPDKINKNGRREIASHYYPLLGAYDSNDSHVLECQVLQMKFSGIDGVVVDWYGVSKANDYPDIHRNTLHLIRFIEKANLKFAICYEDQSVKQMIAGKTIKQEDSLKQGQADLNWIDKNWFPSKSYVKDRNGNPILLVFGPQHFEKDDWRQMRAGLTHNPTMHGLPHLTAAAEFDGSLGWIPVSGGKDISTETWRKYLADLYSRAEGETPEPVIATAFSQFHDIYKQANLHESYGYLDGRKGKTFDETLELAFASKASIVQVATWNDYGEGTMIEPTEEFGYRYLERIQAKVKSNTDTTKTLLQFNFDDLRLPLELFKLRKKKDNSELKLKELDRISDLMFQSKVDEARAAIKSFQN